VRKLSRHYLRKHWLSLCTTILVLYTVIPVRHVDLYDLGALPARLEFLMFVLSFPLGSLFMWAFYTGTGGIGERILLWTMALALGYVQWFHLVPALLARRRPAVTALNLSPGDMVASGPAAPAYAPAPPPEKQLDAAPAPPVPQFDARGLTPLERILNEEVGSRR
jgi:hypothetical protein